MPVCSFIVWIDIPQSENIILKLEHLMESMVKHIYNKIETENSRVSITTKEISIDIQKVESNALPNLVFSTNVTNITFPQVVRLPPSHTSAAISVSMLY